MKEKEEIKQLGEEGLTQKLVEISDKLDRRVSGLTIQQKARFVSLASLSLQVVMLLSSSSPLIASEKKVDITEPTPVVQIVNDTTLTETHVSKNEEPETVPAERLPVRMQEIIKKIKEDYGIEILLPKMVDGKRNMVWNTEDIEALYMSFGELPPNFLSDKGKYVNKILLNKVPDTPYTGPGGWYLGDKTLSLYLPSDFNPDGTYKLEGKEMSGKKRVAGVVIHEFVHAYEDNEEGMLNDWILSFGWGFNKREDRWVISDGYSKPAAVYAYSNPREDIANSAEYVYLDIEGVSEDRIEKLGDYPGFDGWKPLFDKTQLIHQNHR